MRYKRIQLGSLRRLLLLPRPNDSVLGHGPNTSSILHQQEGHRDEDDSESTEQRGRSRSSELLIHWKEVSAECGRREGGKRTLSCEEGEGGAEG